MALPDSVWEVTTGNRLAQGDHLTGCPVPVFPSDYGLTGAEYDLGIRQANLIVVTQSCDLENNKVTLVALCTVLTIDQLASLLGTSFNKGYLEQVRQGRQPALHMIASPDRPDDNMSSLVVDFREIHSLPVAYLARHAEDVGPRWRLRPPYLEHFSQAFARFFMRVGLPSGIAPFK